MGTRGFLVPNRGGALMVYFCDWALMTAFAMAVAAFLGYMVGRESR